MHYHVSLYIIHDDGTVSPIDDSIIACHEFLNDGRYDISMNILGVRWELEGDFVQFSGYRQEMRGDLSNRLWSSRLTNAAKATFGHASNIPPELANVFVSIKNAIDGAQARRNILQIVLNISTRQMTLRIVDAGNHTITKYRDLRQCSYHLFTGQFYVTVVNDRNSQPTWEMKPPSNRITHDESQWSKRLRLKIQPMMQSHTINPTFIVLSNLADKIDEVQNETARVQMQRESPNFAL